MTGSRTIYCAAASGLRDQKAPKDRQQPCFPPKDRSYPSKYLMAATVRLWRSAEDVGLFMPLLTMLYRCYLPKRFRLLRAAFCNFFSLLSTECPYMRYATAQMCRKGIAGRMECFLPGRSGVRATPACCALTTWRADTHGGARPKRLGQRRQGRAHAGRLRLRDLSALRQDQQGAGGDHAEGRRAARQVGKKPWSHGLAYGMLQSTANSLRVRPTMPPTRMRQSSVKRRLCPPVRGPHLSGGSTLPAHCGVTEQPYSVRGHGTRGRPP